MSTIRVGLVQVHPAVGDIAGNRRRIGEGLHEAADAGCELAVCGELARCGYRPQSLIVDEGMLHAIGLALQELAVDLPAGLVAINASPYSPRARPAHAAARSPYVGPRPQRRPADAGGLASRVVSAGPSTTAHPDRPAPAHARPPDPTRAGAPWWARCAR